MGGRLSSQSRSGEVRKEMSSKAAEEGVPTKKAKATPFEEGQSCDPIILPSLLRQLKGELDVSIIADIESAIDSKNDPRNSEDISSTIDKLFADHIGTSPEVVIGNAKRIANEELEIEIETFNQRQMEMNRYSDFDGSAKIWRHPTNRDIKCSKPDCKVWLQIFLGEERTDELLDDTVLMNGDGSGPDDPIMDKEVTEGIIVKALEEEVSDLPTVNLLANVLHYFRNKANKTDIDDLFRFAVVYGLDGVMKDVLNGSYGEIGDLDINCILPLDDNPIIHDGYSMGGVQKLYMPAYGLGAILGHANIVKSTISQLGGKMDCPIGYQMDEEDGVEVYHNKHSVPSEVFYWVFNNNMPEIIKTLVNDCGFQFRWIDHERYLPMMIHRLFETEEYESHPRWVGDIDEEDLMYENSRVRRRMRAASAYSEQMKMLDVLISLGFPFSLFFPTEPPIEREEKLTKDKKLESRDECKAYMRNMDKEERKARDLVYQACSAYNSIQTSKRETLHIGDFYRKLKSRWDGQESVQVDHLPEFEELDSRWRATRRPQDEDEYHDSDSYYDSDDGSSYGDGPFG